MKKFVFQVVSTLAIASSAAYLQADAAHHMAQELVASAATPAAIAQEHQKLIGQLAQLPQQLKESTEAIAKMKQSQKTLAGLKTKYGPMLITFKDLKQTLNEFEIMLNESVKTHEALVKRIQHYADDLKDKIRKLSSNVASDTKNQTAKLETVIESLVKIEMGKI